VAIYVMALDYAAMAINYFRSVQPPKPDTQGKFWHNRTGFAAARVFADAKLRKSGLSWGIAHGVQYGVYLELANNRSHEALRPVIQRYAGRFLNDVRKIYRDN